MIVGIAGDFDIVAVCCGNDFGEPGEVDEIGFVEVTSCCCTSVFICFFVVVCTDAVVFVNWVSFVVVISEVFAAMVVKLEGSNAE